MLYVTVPSITPCRVIPRVPDFIRGRQLFLVSVHAIQLNFELLSLLLNIMDLCFQCRLGVWRRSRLPLALLRIAEQRLTLCR